MSAQKGAFAPEGSALCTIAGTESLVFEINVPYGYRNLAQPGASCLLELPDGTLLKAKVHSMLATMNTVSQTAKVIAKADAPFLPEGMNIKATFTSADASATTTVLPRNAVQSDEYMSVLLLLAGIYSYTRMQSNLFPEVLFPRITVIADAGQQPIRAKGDNRSRRLCPRAYAVSAKHFREHPGP